MLNHFWFLIVAVAVAPLWGQANPEATQTDLSVTDQDTGMLTPPPASGGSYPAAGTGAERSNYLRYGLTFSAAYSDNVFAGVSGHMVGDTNYSVWPTISLDQTTPRLHSVLTYSSGFTFYQKESGRNESDQNAGLSVQYRLSPHVTVNMHDSFQKSSSVFNQPDLVSSTAVPGSAQAPTVAVVAPLADHLGNTTNAGISYQFGANSMVGASGSFAYLNYSNPAEVPGLYDSKSTGGSAFYNHRLSKKHYIGTTYQYSKFLAYPVEVQGGLRSTTQTHGVSGFYTLYLKPTLSFSLSGGTQHYETMQSPQPTSSSWSPTASASMGWQGRRTSFAGSYSRIITGSGGLLGAYHSNSATASTSWQLTRNWNVGSSASYAIYKNVTPFFFLSSPGGHTVSGTASVQRSIGEHLSVQAGYTRMHQSYEGIAAVSTFPDTNREFISLAYQFARPLGR
jgi:hypothetical protein